MRNRPFLILLCITAIMLMIPLIAMQFTDEVNWSFMDFTLAGALFLISGFAAIRIFQKVSNRQLRIASVVVLALVVLFLWAEMAVGLIGSPIAGN